MSEATARADAGEGDVAVVASWRTGPRGLDRARTRVPLIYDLACGDSSMEALGEKYGVEHSSISRFARRYATEIGTQRASLEDKLAAVWIAQKAARLAEYQDDVESINAVHDVLPAPDPSLLGAKHRALRNSAEELGALKTVIDSTVSVRYELVGVDPEALR
jgi:hypothetical protein